MSKKDYQAIAGAIYLTVQGHASADVLRNLVQELSDYMAEDNRHFDRARFIEACETGRTKGMRQVA